MKILVRPRGPVWLLLLLVPAIPEFMTGSAPITPLSFAPLQFAVQLAILMGVYATGRLLVREFATIFPKGWAPVRLLGGAYGILKEGVAVASAYLIFLPRWTVVARANGTGVTPRAHPAA